MEKPSTKPKKRPTKIEEMTKEQIKKAIIKKRECNSKALKIVESLLENNISQEYFLQCLPDINQSHLEDIIEERTILHLCGYPLCSHTLIKNDIPKQKYRISVKTNKVYDITTRKNFCSNICFNAAMYVKKQMLTSPLWFREYEEIPHITIMPSDNVCSLGLEVDVSLVQKVAKASENKQVFTSINEFANASLKDMTADDAENKNMSMENHTISTIDDEKPQAEIIPLPTPSVTKPNDEKHKESKLNSKVETNKKSKHPLNIVGDIIEKPEQRIDPILIQANNITFKENTDTEKKVPQKKQPSVIVITIEVEKCLAEWFTLDTMLLLFGEDKVRDMVTDKKEHINKYLNSYTKSIFYKSSSYDQYQTLCKKLNLLELGDRRNDILQREMKPLPDYSMLQEESKKMQLKVKAFFSGETEIVDTVQAEENASNENITNLPLIDKNAQNALRRRIVLQHLNKVLPDLLRSLGLLTLSISSDVRLLVNTLNLKANNVMFKPIQWTLIAIIVIKLLSLRDPRLEYLLKQPTAFQHMQLLLLSYKQDGGYLDRLISWLTDIDRLLDTNDTQLTIE